MASLPLGRGGEAVAVVCVERQPGPPFEACELARLEQLLALAAPALHWMDRAAQPWHRRIAGALVQAWAALRQPERRSARRLLAGAAAALAFLALAPLENGVSGRARVEGAEQRALTAPADGFVKTVHVRPGDRVRAGAPLLDLLEGDLRLERERWSSQLAQHENAYAAAMAKPDRAAAATSLARISEAQSQLALVDDQLARGRVVAPFDALVIQGDLSQSIGAPVRQGDTLLTLATTGQQRVIVDVDETDIARVQVGQPGGWRCPRAPGAARTSSSSASRRWRAPSRAATFSRSRRGCWSRAPSCARACSAAPSWLFGVQARRVDGLVFGVKPFVSTQAGPELGHPGQDRIEGSAQLRGVRHAVQVADRTPGPAQVFGGNVQHTGNGGPLRREFRGGHGRQSGFGIGQQRIQRGRDVLRADPVKQREIGEIEKWVVHGTQLASSGVSSSSR